MFMQTWTASTRVHTTEKEKHSLQGCCSSMVLEHQVLLNFFSYWLSSSCAFLVWFAVVAFVLAFFFHWKDLAEERSLHLTQELRKMLGVKCFGLGKGCITEIQYEEEAPHSFHTKIATAVSISTPKWNHRHTSIETTAAAVSCRRRHFWTST